MGPRCFQQCLQREGGAKFAVGGAFSQQNGAYIIAQIDADLVGTTVYVTAAEGEVAIQLSDSSIKSSLHNSCCAAISPCRSLKVVLM